MNYSIFKRIIDLFLSFIILSFSLPIIFIFIMLVYIEDRSSPFYIAKRVGKNYKNFNMIKIRSMKKNADKNGIDSTSNNDMRITNTGKIIRRYKVDELTQLINVLFGSMSLVGPRPNVDRDVKLYTLEETKLLNVTPGITDFASIIFSDEGSILKNEKDPDLAYNQLIRPWKSRLGLIYIENKSLLLDMQIVFYTAISLVSKQTSINWINKKLIRFNTDKKLINICKRNEKLEPYPPPGLKTIVKSRISQ
jgi:lipopolysaccharide/colanic/teichoic acid biosynthesis glycosyltransferase|tara:strand:- start:426 stop:1175 length:750 start_codon:yes stop_codon:yes gene_type:complete